MTSPAARMSRRWLSSAMALALTGCASVLGLGPAPHLYRVSPNSTYQANLPHSAAQLLVDVPSAPAGLDTSQIALSRSAVSIDYFADSAWTDRVPLLVQTALLEFVREQQGDHRDRPRIGRSAGRFHPQYRDPALRGSLQFGRRGAQHLGGDQRQACRSVRPRYRRTGLVRATSPSHRLTRSRRSFWPSTRHWEA